jgi:predicted alpha/beta-fold hydrolase
VPCRDYTAPLLLCNRHLQTFLASSRIRARGPDPVAAAGHELVLTTSEGIRLLGALSTPPGPARGLAVLLHGWEGRMDSTYLRRTGRALFRRGFAVFRLNYRDHGRSHHLNTGIFYAVKDLEVFDAVRQAAAAAAELPAYLVGFSLGGNFALRIARRAAADPIPTLKHVVAVGPVLDPAASTDRVDRYPLIRAYFMKKWRRSMAIKQALYPDRYDFRAVMRLKTVRATTARLVADHSDYPSLDAYFQGYTLTGDRLGSLRVPTTLVTAADDPVIPVADFRRLSLGPSTRVVIRPHGGHLGFLESLALRSRYERDLPDVFEALQAADDACIPCRQDID